MIIELLSILALKDICKSVEKCSEEFDELVEDIESLQYCNRSDYELFT